MPINGKKSLNISAELHQRLRVYAATAGIRLEDVTESALRAALEDTRPASVLQCDEKVLTGQASPVKIIQNLREYRSDRVWLAAVALIDALLNEDAAHATSARDAATIAETARARLDAVRSSAIGVSDTALEASDSGSAGRSRARRTRV